MFTTVVITGMAIGRMAIGLAPFIAAKPSSKFLGFPEAHDNASTRLMARMFGVRNIGLGVLALWALQHREALPFALLFNSLMDAGDLAAITIPLVKRQGIDRAAIASAAFAMFATVSWLTMWLVAQ